jgi:hypothetical protein
MTTAGNLQCRGMNVDETLVNKCVTEIKSNGNYNNSRTVGLDICASASSEVSALLVIFILMVGMEPSRIRGTSD